MNVINKLRLTKLLLSSWSKAEKITEGKMTSTTQKIVQLLQLIGHTVTLATDLFPDPRHKLIATVVISTASGLAGIVGSKYNPDGTRAEVAYQPPPKP